MATITEPATSSPAKKRASMVQPAINLMNWIEENRDKFKPPVSNRYLYDGRDFFVMVIKGPNARNDFHLVDSEEYFYQLKGDIKVRIREGDRIVDYLVREGETFFIPPKVPHAPVRPPNTMGLWWSGGARPGSTSTSSFIAIIAARWSKTSISTAAILSSISAKRCSISGAMMRVALARNAAGKSRSLSRSSHSDLDVER